MFYRIEKTISPTKNQLLWTLAMTDGYMNTFVKLRDLDKKFYQKYIDGKQID